jgi:hypothetical protein
MSDATKPVTVVIGFKSGQLLTCLMSIAEREKLLDAFQKVYRLNTETETDWLYAALTDTGDARPIALQLIDVLFIA